MREVVRVGWCGLALTTLVAALRVWWPIHCAAVRARRGSDVRLADWSTAQASALLGFVAVAFLNLTAGVVSWSVPVRPDAHWPPKERVDWVPVLLPLIFVASAVVKLLIVLVVWRSYQRVTFDRGATTDQPVHTHDGALD
jgi:hypothetical protein